MTVDLARTDRHAGAPGEGDALRGLEIAVGGNGDDRLLGDDAANTLWGGTGGDLLVGRAGDDQLEGRRIKPRTWRRRRRHRRGRAERRRGPQPQRVSCGPGQDLASSLFLNDFAEDDCETVVSVGIVPRAPPAAPADQLGPSAAGELYHAPARLRRRRRAALRSGGEARAIARAAAAPSEGPLLGAERSATFPTAPSPPHRAPLRPRQPPPAPLSLIARPHPAQHRSKTPESSRGRLPHPPAAPS